MLAPKLSKLAIAALWPHFKIEMSSHVSDISIQEVKDHSNWQKQQSQQMGQSNFKDTITISWGS